MDKVHAIIPARLDSTRLPRKILADIHGKPMIQRVYEQVLKSGVDSIYIATDSEEIKKVVDGFGAKTIITGHHNSGTDRIVESIQSLDCNSDDDIVINVQGDEPLIPPENINQVSNLLINTKDAVIATLFEEIHGNEENGHYIGKAETQ